MGEDLIPAERPSRRRARTREGISDDRVAIRIFALADYADNAGGKILMAGGGITQVFLQKLPGPLPRLFLVVRVRVPWTMRAEPHTLRLRLLDADRQPVAAGSDKLVDGRAELGTPPGFHAGDELHIDAILGFEGIPVQKEETIYFHLVVDEQEIGRLPLKVRQLR